METFREATLCFRTYKNFELKVKLSWIGIRERKESAFVQRLSCPKEIFLTFVFYLNVWCIGKNSRMYILFHIKKQHYFVHFLCLFLKLSIAFCVSLTFSWRRPLSYRHQSIDLRTKSMDWFLYDNGLRHERVKENKGIFSESRIVILKQHTIRYRNFVGVLRSSFCKMNYKVPQKTVKVVITLAIKWSRVKKLFLHQQLRVWW